MKLSIIPKKYGELLSRDGIDGIPVTFRESIINDLKDDDVTLDIKEANYGTGADWIWLAISLYGIYKIIIEGDKIDKGLNGWSNIFKRIKKLHKRSSHVKYDTDVLLLFALNELFKSNKKIDQIYFIKKAEFDIHNNSSLFLNKPTDEFTSKDDAYTIFILKTSEMDIYIIGVRINGEVEILKRISVQSFK